MSFVSYIAAAMCYFYSVMKAVWVFIFVVAVVSVKAQQKHIVSRQQFWIGHTLSSMIAKKWSLWNDFHFVSNSGFFVARTGITYHLPQTAITGGYALLLAPNPYADNKLQRKEHRPWAQALISTPLSGNFSLTNRIRYDARFRQELVNGKLTDDYVFTNRIRFQTTIRKTFPKWKHGDYLPFVNLGEEVLMNFGKNVKFNTFDQFRLSLTFGVQTKNTQYMTGYVYRYVLNGYNSNTDVFDYSKNHCIALWVIQKFDLRKIKHPHHHTTTNQSAD